MAKICVNKECKEYNRRNFFDDDDIRCSECNQLLEESASGMVTCSSEFAMDNRLDYQSGDRTIVGGDNIANQNIDNRNITTNTSNVVNNVTNYQTVNASVETIECAISGKPLLLHEKIRCQQCKRYVGPKYFDDNVLMCVECRDKKTNVPISHSGTADRPLPRNEGQDISSKVIPPLIPTSSAAENRPQKPVIEPINPARSQKSGRNNKLLLLIGTAVVVLAAYLIYSFRGDPPVEQSITEQPVTKQISQEAAVTPVPVTPDNSTAKTEKIPEIVPEEIKEKEEVRAIKKESAFDQAITTYKEGNFTKANLLFSQAAQEGNSTANYYLAKMYKDGKGVTKNIKKSYELMLKAAEGGCEDAYYEVADMIRTGNGTESNRTKAKTWYEKAALSNKNSDKASEALAKYY